MPRKQPWLSNKLAGIAGEESVLTGYVAGLELHLVRLVATLLQIRVDNNTLNRLA